MRKIILLLSSSALIAVSGAAWAAGPSVSFPDDVPAQAVTGAPALPANDEVGMDAGTLAILMQMASDEYVESYSNIDLSGSVDFHGTTFQPTTPGPVTPVAADARQAPGAPALHALTPSEVNPAGPAYGVITPEALMAMAEMSPEEIMAVAKVYAISAGDEDLAAKISQSETVAPQMDIGIPSLDDALPAGNAEEILAQLMAAHERDLAAQHQQSAPEAEAPPMPVQNLDMKGWVAGLAADGHIYIENTRLSNSRVDVVAGDIVGKFGMISKVSTQQGKVFVEFASGDRIEDPANAAYVEPEPAPTVQYVIAGEINLTKDERNLRRKVSRAAPAPRPDRENVSTEASGPAQSASGLPHPVARPARAEVSPAPEPRPDAKT